VTFVEPANPPAQRMVDIPDLTVKRAQVDSAAPKQRSGLAASVTEMGNVVFLCECPIDELLWRARAQVVSCDSADEVSRERDFIGRSLVVPSLATGQSAAYETPYAALACDGLIDDSWSDGLWPRISYWRISTRGQGAYFRRITSSASVTGSLGSERLVMIFKMTVHVKKQSTR
jgi:hypothetical protein